MAKHKAFLLRMNPGVLDAVQRWADDELRSLNGQIEYLLRKALIDARRAKPVEPAVEPAVERVSQSAENEEKSQDFID